jgi:hypothetical protein
MIPSPTGQVRVGVTSEEPAVTSYRVVLRGQRATTLASWTVDLSRGQEWTTDVAVPRQEKNLQLDLFRAGEPNVVYRHATMTRG